MKTFRAYLLDGDSRIVWGEWIEALSEEDALAKAHTLCGEGTPTVELWEGARHVAEIDCAS